MMITWVEQKIYLYQSREYFSLSKLVLNYMYISLISTFSNFVLYVSMGSLFNKKNMLFQLVQYNHGNNYLLNMKSNLKYQ